MPLGLIRNASEHGPHWHPATVHSVGLWMLLAGIALVVAGFIFRRVQPEKRYWLSVVCWVGGALAICLGGVARWV